MPTLRLFQNMALREKDEFELTLDAAHYLGQVRRAHEGDSVILFNGQGGEYQAEISQMKKNHVRVRVGAFQNVERESPLNLELAQGIARGEKMDLIVQKAVELGVKKIIPLLTERSNVKLDEEKKLKRQQHWQQVAISACEQCGRNRVPEISTPLILEEWLPQFDGFGVLLSPEGQSSAAELKLSRELPTTLLIGPEGGFSDKERSLIHNNRFSSLRLGSRILRTETASLATISLLQGLYGDLV